MIRLETRARWAMALCWATLAGPALAAGGHHAVDDAAILEPGACEAESWFERSGALGRNLHLGGSCRVGPLELGIAGDYQRQAGASQTGYGVQAKWAQDIGAGWSVGLAAGPSWQARDRPRYQGTTASALLTWAASETVQVHANLGRDFLHGAGDEPRSGLGVDWTPREGWLLTLERFRQDAGHFARAGVRWTPAKDWSVDVSRAVRLSGTGDSSWTLGLTRNFER